MNRGIIAIFFLLGMMLQLKAQTLSEAEVTAKMTEAFELNKANRKAEALELFLLVGKNTKQQRSEGERQVYVCSQMMACMCYEGLKQYKDGYLLAEKLLLGKLNEQERKEIGRLYAMNGYFFDSNGLHFTLICHKE